MMQIDFGRARLHLEASPAYSTPNTPRLSILSVMLLFLLLWLVLIVKRSLGFNNAD